MNPMARVTAVKSLGQIEGLLRKFTAADVNADALTQLQSISREIKRLIGQRKDAFCECDCPECVAGDCENCSNPECVDPNCEGSMAVQEQREALAALESIAKVFVQ